MITKEEAYLKVSELVERFTEQLPSYKKADYNETLTRQDFINPFFKALGWDVDNSFGNAEAYREVIHEDKVKVGGATKAPDYSFRLPGGHRLFFVEAKKPSVVVRDEILPAYQVRRYGWSAKLPISLITDFEEFAIYDCTKKPNPTDKASHGRIKYLTFKDYLNEFDFIWDTFSKERVLKGSFDKFVKSDTHKKGTATVDKDFLASLDEWRKQLALNIALRNPHLNEDDLNFVVQQTLDRIIFLRIAEDRGVEEYGQLKKLISSPTGGGQSVRTPMEEGAYYQQLYRLFKEADSKYNSGLFDFKKDHLSHNISIDNKVIKSIINELYYPISPYEFSVLSVEILGSAYEQFLGKQIKLDKHHRAIIEEKPEVRKAGGVYYTPQYIVEYIVQNTVGKKIEELEKRYNDEKASPTGGGLVGAVSNLTIVDPACGSGSFLIGAYDYLMKWHLLYYKPEFTELSEKAANSNLYNIKQRQDFIKQRNKLPLTPEGHLTTALKKQILLNNIYGVDIDTQAVEVTKLSLLLKCMEGETASSINAEMRFGERVLPTLDSNIKSGNSLIDLDFYDTKIDFGEEKKIKPFNWQQAFPNIFSSSLRGTKQSADGTAGFDVVIGNPPWVDLKGHPSELIDYYFAKYKTANNRINLYALFVDKGLTVLNQKGQFGFIIPSSLLQQSSYKELRYEILTNRKVNQIVRLPDNVFQNVKAETCILLIGNDTTTVDNLIYDRKAIINHLGKDNANSNTSTSQDIWLEREDVVFDIFSNYSIKNLLLKIEENKLELEEICDFCLGITPYDKYKGHSPKQISERVFHSLTKKDQSFKPLLSGSNVSRYSVNWDGEEYISYGSWLGAPRDQKFFKEPRILIRQIVSGKPLRIYAAYTDKELYNTQTIFNLVLKKDKNYNLKFLLAIINSNLMNFYHGYKYLDLSKNLFQKILIQNCKKFPIINSDLFKKREWDIHNNIIKLVEIIMQLSDEKQNTTLPEKIDQLNQHIAYTDEKINKLVYELYGLSEEEIGIVEGR